MRFPAARVGDPHICPMFNGLVPHVGGPVIPPAAVRVLTGKMPQARVMDMCTCVGPPDSIATGAMNVIVQGQPAARMLADSTMHGGRIIWGCITVLIGMDGVVAPPIVPPAVPTPECAALAAAYDDAVMANHTYGEDPTVPLGVREVSPSELAALGLSPNDLAPPGSTFRAEVFVRDTPGGPHYTVAYRGTAEGADWIANAQQGVGMRSDHYDSAMSIARQVDKASGGNVSFTGHSLGGGLASSAAAVTGRPANTFNSAGLSARTVGGYPETPAPVDAYYVPGEMLSGLQDNRGAVLGGLTGLAGAVHPSLGGLLGGWIAGREMGDSPILPGAYGTRHRLPNSVPPGKSTLDSLNPIDRHGMDWVLHCMEEQQRAAGCI